MRFVHAVESSLEGLKEKETFSGLGTSRAGGERGSLGVGGAGKRGIFKSQNKYRVTK